MSFGGLNYIGAYELKGNELMIEFTLSMAQYLASLPIINYPRSFYALDDREYNAYAIGEAMCVHCSQDNNVMRRTEDKLRVETLLKSMSYPSYEEIKANRWRTFFLQAGTMQAFTPNLTRMAEIHESEPLRRRA